jgi:hypothetical protein
MKNHAAETYGGMEVQIYEFLNLSVYADESSD